MSLAEALAARIAATGPITVAEYMADCLTHPNWGYYTTRDPLGAAGDFTTAPEISQMFGELIGLALAQAWLDRGGGPCVLAELGPGRGTLMADVLRATARVPGFRDAVAVHLVEASPVLRAHQRQLLGEVTHHSRVATLPEAPIYLIANEFFDALPVRQFLRTAGGWSERRVGLVAGALAFGLAPAGDLPALAGRDDVAEGGLVEICPGAAAIIGEVARRIGAHGGAALVVDYGGWRSLGDTLQAVRDHGYVDVFDGPGSADLTAHVDFEALAQAAPGLAASGLTPQGVFLDRLGIGARAEALARGLTGAALASHRAAHRRLTHGDEMGNLFKVLGLVRPGEPALPGLDP